MTLSDGFPPFYSERQSSATVGTNQLYLGFAVIATMIGLILVLPGVRGKDRIFFFVRWSVTLFIGAAIIACVQGMSWHVGNIEAVMPYGAQTQQLVELKVGLMVGLTHFNVTLKGSPDGNDLIFSEQFYFRDSDVEFEKALRKGLPFPILNVLEHFTVNRISSQWLWGQRYWIAGHYANYMLWSAFAAWIITNIFLQTVLRYGGLMLALTGLLMTAANLSFISINAHGVLAINLGYLKPVVLTPVFGWCFWVCLGMGGFCILLGFIIFAVDHIYPKSLQRFFDISREDEFDLFDVDTESLSSTSRRSSEAQILSGEAKYGYQKSDEESFSPVKKYKPPSPKKSPHSSNKEGKDNFSFEMTITTDEDPRQSSNLNSPKSLSESSLNVDDTDTEAKHSPAHAPLVENLSLTPTNNEKDPSEIDTIKDVQL